MRIEELGDSFGMVGSSKIEPLCIEPARVEEGECISDELLRRCWALAGLNSPGPSFPNSGIAKRCILGVFRRSTNALDGEEGVERCFEGRCELSVFLASNVFRFEGSTDCHNVET